MSNGQTKNVCLRPSLLCINSVNENLSYYLFNSLYMNNTGKCEKCYKYTFTN